jgi:hypothetical protein
MSPVAFVLEPGLGAKVRLRPLPGGPPVAEEDLRQMEQELRRRYEWLVMTTDRTVEVRGQEFLLEKQTTGDPRMPRLVLTAACDAAGPAVAACGWREGLLAELRCLETEAGDAPHHERGALRGCADELGARLAEADGNAAGVLLATYLVAAEAHFRGSDGDRAGQYALALRALRRRLPGTTGDLHAPAALTEVPANRSFLTEYFAWLFGTDAP